MFKSRIESSLEQPIGFALIILLIGLISTVFINTQRVHAIASCSSTPTDKGVATSTVDIPSTASYTVWSRIKSTTSSNDSYVLRIDNQCITVGDSGLTNGEWTWVNYEDGDSSKVVRLSLTAGSHTITMAGREDGVGLDRLLFLSDGACQPTGLGDNCAVNDTIAPDIYITYPQAGDIVKGVTSVAVDISDQQDVAKVELFVDGALETVSTEAPYSLPWDTTAYSNTTHTVNAKVTDPSGNTNQSATIQVSVNNSATSGITSKIEAEDYNSGGEGVGYHDTTAGNLGTGTCRNDDVDMKNTTDVGGGCTVGWFDPGEWMEYDLNIETAGVYDITLRIANGRNDGNNGLLSINLDGDDISAGGIVIPNTGGWESFATVWKGNVSLPVGNHTLRLRSIDFFDINWFAFTGEGEVLLASTTPTPDTTPPTQPTNLKATSIEQQSVTMSWNQSTDSDSGVSGYNIYRDNIQIAQVNDVTYTDTTVSPETTYSYAVSAIDKTGNESAKANLSVTTPQAVVETCLPADVNQDGTVTITDAVAVILRLDETGVDAGRADVNQDGTVTITDAVAVILQLDQASGCN